MACCKQYLPSKGEVTFLPEQLCNLEFDYGKSPRGSLTPLKFSAIFCVYRLFLETEPIISIRKERKNSEIFNSTVQSNNTLHFA